MTPIQNKIIHAMLAKAHLMSQKADIISGITSGRTASSREMNVDEAQAMITYLKSVSMQAPKPPDPADKMRKKMISLAHEMHWHIPGTSKVDMQRLNAWCVKYGYLKKHLNKYAYSELPTLVSQFEALYKSYLYKFQNLKQNQ